MNASRWPVGWPFSDKAASVTWSPPCHQIELRMGENYEHV